MSQFNIGDKVRIKKGPYQPYAGRVFEVAETPPVGGKYILRFLGKAMKGRPNTYSRHEDELEAAEVENA